MLPAGAVLRVPLRPHSIDAPQAQTVFFEEEDHRHKGRVTSERDFRNFSGEKKDAGYI